MKKAILTIMVVIGLILTSCYWKDWDKMHPAGSGGGTSATSCTVDSLTILYNSAPVFRPSCVVDTGTKMSYSIDISPIINTKCGANSGCHGAGCTSAGGNPRKDYSIYGNNRTGVYSDCTGDTVNATLWSYVSPYYVPLSTDPMPKAGSPALTTCERNKIRNWIHQGAQNN
ncbi:MAG TPA: hypothetical protein VF411_01970 [Bacteroidia bacterium]